MAKTSTIAKPSIKNNYTKIAGVTYALIIIIATFPTMIFDLGTLLKNANAAENFMGQEGTFRVAIAIEFLMFVLVMVLSWALYVLLKPVNKNLALFGLIFRFGEALLGCVAIMFILTVLLFLTGAEYLQAFEPTQLQGLARFFANLYGVSYDILLFIMGIGGIAYCYLFYISRYIPRALSVWGMITYATMVAYGFINIAVHNAPSELAYAMAPGALFELSIGLWLMFKGISVTP
ncbi:DUF4386 domain-containing protein [Thalassotalea sp. M1531]|uniref:DUF4386 domain-containing protein n=1 Tax=Thalassotalea algicola TaxID=2716224 RepID=A0A7Y0LGI7_9GAMM|nr:DUF4386 domain-containing protein [Thalassotalea algicola]NMP32785.1 DUF4386 domain-containing protein [Thalassotalea algicola]